MLVVSPLNVTAAEWVLAPDVELTGTYNDNILLTVEPVNSVYGAILDLSAHLNVRTERSELKFTPLFRFNRYWGEEGLDSDDQFFYLAMSHAVSERADIALDTSFVRNTTLNSELLDIGRVIAGVRREKFEITPSADYRFSEKNSVQLDYTYSNINYDADPVTTGLFDYEYQIGEAAAIRRFSERDEASVGAFISRFDAPDVKNVTNSVGLQGGYAREFSPTLSGSVAFGIAASEVEISNFGNKRDSRITDPIWDLRINKRFERMAFEGRLRRYLRPTGSGALVRRDQLDLTLTRRFSPRTDGDVTFTAFRNSPLNIDDSGSRDVLRIFLRLSHHFSKDWKLSGEYRFFMSDTSRSDPAYMNAIFINLTYTGGTRAWSH